MAHATAGGHQLKFAGRQMLHAVLAVLAALAFTVDAWTVVNENKALFKRLLHSVPANDKEMVKRAIANVLKDEWVEDLTAISLTLLEYNVSVAERRNLNDFSLTIRGAAGYNYFFKFRYYYFTFRYVD